MPRAEPELDIELAFREGTPIHRALDRAARRALGLHKRLGLPVAAWRDGRVVWIPPEEIPDDAVIDEPPT